ncbi:MAG: hypothetical protein QM784_00820 [Polyangiaceae bacterium]
MKSDRKRSLPVVLDCLECGACCFQRPGTILVTSDDITRWTESGRTDILEQLEPGHFAGDGISNERPRLLRVSRHGNPSSRLRHLRRSSHGLP